MTKKLALIALLGLVLAGYFLFDGQRFVSVAFFQQSYAANPLLSAAIYFVIYVLVAAFSLPVAALLTLVAGMIFGLATGTLLVSFASSLGATLSCLFSRFLLRDWVQRRLGAQAERINNGLAKDGVLYLFTLRLIPAFPFWMVNLAFGMTKVPLGKFYLVSQLGMLPGTLVYVNAGAQLGAVEQFTLKGILTPGLLGSFVLLAIFPYFVRGLMAGWRRRKLLARFTRPTRFDTNLIVIGAGSAGLVTAYLAAAVKAQVTLVEKHLMGGDCLNTGCVPSKALLRAAKAVADARAATALGVDVGNPQVDFRRVMGHVHGAVERIAPHDSIARYTELGVDCVTGSARLISPWQVEVNGKILSAPKIVIASGGRPRIPAIPGLADFAVLTSENLWSLTELPARLLILGGGPIGCEMAQAFQRLGSQVTLLQRRDRLLPKVDTDAASLIENKLVAEGVAVITSCQISRFHRQDGDSQVVIRRGDLEQSIAFDQVLVAVGRQANTAGLGLEELGIPCRDDGTIETNEFLQTNYPTIFACGDVCGPYQLTHASSHQAWYAMVNALFGGFKKFRVDYRLMPSVVYTDPEVAVIGLNESDAVAQGIPFEVTKYPLSGLDRAIADRATDGFVKVLTVPGRDKILGVTIVASRAGDMLMDFAAAMKQGKGLNSILGTIHPYPIFSEANKAAAGQWKRSHTPEKLLSWVAKYHRWRLK